MIGNYFMIVKATVPDGVLDHTFREIKEALAAGCLVVMFSDEDTAWLYGLIEEIDFENLKVTFYGTPFAAEDEDSYPVRDDG